MRNYGITTSDILAEIRSHRKLIPFWTQREMMVTAQAHRDSVRDLQIMLLTERFPNNTFPTAFTYGADFSPFVVVTPDTENTENTDTENNEQDNEQNIGPYLTGSDLIALTDAIADNVHAATGEKVTA